MDAPPAAYRQVSQAPTLPGGAPHEPDFDVAALYETPLGTGPAPGSLPLDEKLRQAYFWIVNHAIISPHYDMEFSDGPSPSVTLGDTKARLTLPSGQSYSSFVLIPLLTFAVRRRCLLVGGPGRGKTASAILMGVLAGYPLREVRRAMQHGHPQLTISDLLGEQPAPPRQAVVPGSQCPSATVGSPSPRVCGGSPGGVPSPAAMISNGSSSPVSLRTSSTSRSSSQPPGASTLSGRTVT